MNRKMIDMLRHHIGEVVTIAGWIETIRNQKRMQFLVVRDRSGKVQVVHEKSADETLSAIVASLTPESAVWVTGQVAENAQVKLGGLELVVQTIRVENVAATPLPIDANSGLDARLDWRFLDLRDVRRRLIFEVQTTVEQAMRAVWQREGFIELHSPKLMAAASEGGAELFQLPYFQGTACLAQSPQLYKQMAMAAGFERVFEIGPVFRANPSFTSRHDTEFTSIDVELSWVDSHYDVMAFEERMLQFVLREVAMCHADAIREHFGVEVVVPTVPFPKVTMAEAYELLATRYQHTIERELKGDLDPQGERLLCQWAKEEHGHEFIFVTDYPVSARPFYHMRYAHDPATTKSFDLLWKGLEVTTGAQREHRYDVLAAQAIEKGVDLGTMRHYADCFRYGCPPHGGFGLGLTRILMLLVGEKSVREVTFIYRGPNRLEP